MRGIFFERLFIVATIKDISIKAGVSYSTVSRALNNTGRMSPETRKKILKIAKELNYVPNFSARGLVMSRSYNIGVFTVRDENTKGTFYEILEGVQSVAGFSYNLVFRILNNLENFAEFFQYKKYDGIIFFSSLKSDVAYIDLISSIGVPYVIINQKMNKKGCLNVIAQDFEGAYMATKHLIDLNHRKIAYIDGSRNNVVESERLNGYIAALTDHNIPIDDRYIIASTGLSDSAFKAALHFSELNDSPTAVFSYSDPVAIGVMKAFHQLGLKVPDDIAVVGFDDMDFAQYFQPTLTSIHKSRVEMGEVASQMLIDVLNGKELAQTTISLETRLIIRESSGTKIKVK